MNSYKQEEYRNCQIQQDLDANDGNSVMQLRLGREVHATQVSILDTPAEGEC